MTQPQCWEDKNAQLFAQSLGVSPTSHVCWPCRDYIGKVMKLTARICSDVGYKRERVAQQCSVAN